MNKLILNAAVSSGEKGKRVKRVWRQIEFHCAADEGARSELQASRLDNSRTVTQ